MKPEAGFRRPSHLRHLVRSAMSTPALRTLPTIKFCKPFSAPRQHAQPFWLESDSSMGPSVRVHRPRPRARGHARSPTPPIRRTSAATRALTALVLTVRVRQRLQRRPPHQDGHGERRPQPRGIRAARPSAERLALQQANQQTRPVPTDMRPRGAACAGCCPAHLCISN